MLRKKMRGLFPSCFYIIYNDTSDSNYGQIHAHSYAEFQYGIFQKATAMRC